MKKFSVAILVLLIASCGETPAPKVEKKPPEVKSEPKAPEAPKTEAPKPDPSQALAQRVKSVDNRIQVVLGS